MPLWKPGSRRWRQRASACPTLGNHPPSTRRIPLSPLPSSLSRLPGEGQGGGGGIANIPASHDTSQFTLPRRASGLAEPPPSHPAAFPLPATGRGSGRGWRHRKNSGRRIGPRHRTGYAQKPSARARPRARLIRPNPPNRRDAGKTQPRRIQDREIPSIFRPLTTYSAPIRNAVPPDGCSGHSPRPKPLATTALNASAWAGCQRDNGGRFSTISPAAHRIRCASSPRGTSLSGHRM